MPNEPQLIPVTVPRRPVAVALVLHGGASRSGSPMVSPTQPSVMRMIPIARRIARLGGDRLAVLRLLNSTLAAEFAVATLLDQPTSDTIVRVLAGECWIEV